MTKTLIIGGGGMVGQKLAHRLAAQGLAGHDAMDVTLLDMGFPENGAPAQARITGNIGDEAKLREVLSQRFDLIFHLAAIVSGESETNFDLGWTINMRATWNLLESLRYEHTKSGGSYRPRVIFTSSIAVFGAPFPDQIGDEFFSSPQTSYGAQKACGEMMVQDFSRKGFIEGMSLRLPTICVRPGKANLAASSFFSGIIREPLNGKEAILPVPSDVRHWHASPRSAAGFLAHAATLELSRLENRLALSLPGVSCTVEEQIEALRRIAGQDVVNLIKPQLDEAVMAIVKNWPRDFAPDRAKALGFVAETSFEEIIQTYIEDDLKPAA